MGRMGVDGIHYRTRAPIDEAPAPPPAVLWEPSPANPVDVVAHHEAGHTILAVYQHEPLHSVEIFLGRFRWKVSKFCEDV
jgi:hypothetical protein